MFALKDLQFKEELKTKLSVDDGFNFSLIDTPLKLLSVWITVKVVSQARFQNQNQSLDCLSKLLFDPHDLPLLTTGH